MGKSDDDFVRSAFKEAIEGASEAGRANEAFNRTQKALIGKFIKEFGRDSAMLFMEINDSLNCRAALSCIMRIFFLAGFRNGVIYKSRTKQ